MSAPRLDQVVAAIVGAIARDHGSDLDLSGTGRVLRGRYPSPPAVPFAAVSGTQIETRRGPVLTRWSSRCQVDVIVWCPVDGLDLSSRVVRCEEVADAVVASVQGAAVSPGNALYALPDLAFEAVGMDSDLDGAAEQSAQVLVTISWTLHRSTPGLAR